MNIFLYLCKKLDLIVMSDNKPLSPLDAKIQDLAKQLLSCNQETMYDLYDFYQDKEKKSRAKYFLKDTSLKEVFDEIRTLLKNHKQDRDQIIMKMLTLLNMLQYGTACDLKNTECGIYIDEAGNVVDDDTSQYEIVGEVHYIPNPDEAETVIALYRLKIIIKYLEREYDKLLDNIEETTIVNETEFTTNSDIVKEFIQNWIYSKKREEFRTILYKLHDEGYITSNPNGAYTWNKKLNEYTYLVILLEENKILKSRGTDDQITPWEELNKVFKHKFTAYRATYKNQTNNKEIPNTSESLEIIVENSQKS